MASRNERLRRGPQAAASAIYDYYCGAPPIGQRSEPERKPQPEAKSCCNREGPNGTKCPRVEDIPGLARPRRARPVGLAAAAPAQEQRVMIMGGGNTYTTIKGSGQSAIDLTDEINLRKQHPVLGARAQPPPGMTETARIGARRRRQDVRLGGRAPRRHGARDRRPPSMRTEDVHEAAIFNPSTNEFTPSPPIRSAATTTPRRCCCPTVRDRARLQPGQRGDGGRDLRDAPSRSTNRPTSSRAPAPRSRRSTARANEPAATAAQQRPRSGNTAPSTPSAYTSASRNPLRGADPAGARSRTPRTPTSARWRCRSWAATGAAG